MSLVVLVKINVVFFVVCFVASLLEEPHLVRSEDPLKYWMNRKGVYPHVFKLAPEYLCIPKSSSVLRESFLSWRNTQSEKKLLHKTLFTVTVFTSTTTDTYLSYHIILH